MNMRCCPLCYAKVYLRNTGTQTRGTEMKINYEIVCSNCGLGLGQTGSVIITYNASAMKPVTDDSNLKELIEKWDSIERNPEKEKETKL